MLNDLEAEMLLALQAALSLWRLEHVPHSEMDQVKAQVERIIAKANAKGGNENE